MRFKYHRMHVPTGKTHTLEMDCFNERQFLYWIANWNKQPTWRYWFDEVPSDLRVGDFAQIHPTIITR